MADDLEFFDVEGRPYLFDTQNDEGWIWSGLKWRRQSPQFIRSHFDGEPIAFTDFKRLFPKAANSLEVGFANQP